MKKLLLLLMFCLLLLTVKSISQVKSIPVNVSKAFTAKYPTATQISWLSNTDCYAARFYLRGEPCTAKFAKNGVWLDETQKISYGELGNSVKNGFIQSKFSGWRAREVNSIREKDKEIEYRILILNNNQEKRYIYFDAKGQIKKEEMTL